MNQVPAHITALLALLAIGLIPPWLAPAHLGVLAMLWLFMVLALSWDLVGGQMGYPSLGHVAFFTLGMHAGTLLQMALLQPCILQTGPATGSQAALDTMQSCLGLVLGIPFGGLIALLTALLLGVLLLRLPWPHFAIATLGLAMTTTELTTSLPSTNSPLAPPVILPGSTSPQLPYWLAFGLATLTLTFFAWLHASRFRLTVNAIRDDEHKATTIGHPVMRNKMIAWTISAFFTGMAGATFANLSSTTPPGNTEIGIAMVLMVMLGGKGTFWGPVIGAITLFGISELLLSALLPGWRLAVLAAMLLLVTLYLPHGIIGWLRRHQPAPFSPAHPPAEPCTQTVTQAAQRHHV